MNTDNEIGVEGAVSLCELLKNNSSLTDLNIDCKGEISYYHVYEFIYASALTANWFEEEGSAMICEGLKNNSSIVKVYLSS